MDISEDLKSNYLNFFNSFESFEFAFSYPENSNLQELHIRAIYLFLNEKSRLRMCQFDHHEEFFIIDTDIYTVYVVVLPTSDIVYFTVNKNTNTKENYGIAITLSAFIDFLKTVHLT